MFGLKLKLLPYDINEFNKRFIDFLNWYNTQRPHKSLNNKSA
ncbi:MAG: integrase core domain-containing protein [Caldisericaceae bacterium]